MPRQTRRRSPPSSPPPGASYDPWIEQLAWLMDSSIGVGRWSIGVDGLLGLVPGLGDLAGSLISLAIVMRAVRAGVPRIAIARMVTNIAIDSLLGSVPVIGDLFDFAYKANMRNLRIYNETVSGARGGTLRHWLFFAALALGVMAVVAIPLAVVVMISRAI